MTDTKIRPHYNLYTDEQLVEAVKRGKHFWGTLEAQYPVEEIAARFEHQYKTGREVDARIHKAWNEGYKEGKKARS